MIFAYPYNIDAMSACILVCVVLILRRVHVIIFLLN